MLGGDAQSVELLYGVRFVVAQVLVYHVEIGLVEGLGEGGATLGTAVVALLAGEGAALAEVAEEHAAAALRVGEGVFLHRLDAEGVLLLALLIHGRGDDDAGGLDALLREGHRGAGAAGYILYHARATEAEQRFVEGLELDAAHLADVFLIDKYKVAEHAAIEAQQGADDLVGRLADVVAAV